MRKTAKGQIWESGGATAEYLGGTQIYRYRVTPIDGKSYIKTVQMRPSRMRPHVLELWIRKDGKNEKTGEI